MTRAPASQMQHLRAQGIPPENFLWHSIWYITKLQHPLTWDWMGLILLPRWACSSAHSLRLQWIKLMPKYADGLEMKHHLTQPGLRAGVSCADGLHFTSVWGLFAFGKGTGQWKTSKTQRKMQKPECSCKSINKRKPASLPSSAVGQGFCITLSV